jgi:hypothetical protein
MLSNRVLLWLKKLWEDELCWDERGNVGGRGLFCCREFFKEEVEIGEGGKEGRASGHILNTTDRFFDGIILMVTSSIILLVSMSRHYMVCLFESRCNSIDNGVYKNLHVILLFDFFILSIPTKILLVYTDDIFSSVFIDEVNDGQIQSIKSIAKYRRIFHSYTYIITFGFF